MATLIEPESWDEFLETNVRCPRCDWHGTVRSCDPDPHSLAYCPVCGKEVLRDKQKRPETTPPNPFRQLFP